MMHAGVAPRPVSAELGDEFVARLGYVVLDPPFRDDLEPWVLLAAIPATGPHLAGFQVPRLCH